MIAVAPSQPDDADEFILVFGDVKVVVDGIVIAGILQMHLRNQKLIIERFSQVAGSHIVYPIFRYGFVRAAPEVEAVHCAGCELSWNLRVMFEVKRRGATSTRPGAEAVSGYSCIQFQVQMSDQ
jgi:hypothetical protein